MNNTESIETVMYRIKRVTAVAGAITMKDELKFNFELVAKKQDG